MLAATLASTLVVPAALPHASPGGFAEASFLLGCFFFSWPPAIFQSVPRSWKSLWCWKTSALCHLNPRAPQAQWAVHQAVCSFKAQNCSGQSSVCVLRNVLMKSSCPCSAKSLVLLHVPVLCDWIELEPGGSRLSVLSVTGPLKPFVFPSVFSNGSHSPVSSFGHGSLTHSPGWLSNCHVSIKAE